MTTLTSEGTKPVERRLSSFLSLSKELIGVISLLKPFCLRLREKYIGNMHLRSIFPYPECLWGFT